MQVILDSSFARPGSGPKRGGKNGEFRDWTNVKYVTVTLGTDKERVNLPYIRTCSWKEKFSV